MEYFPSFFDILDELEASSPSIPVEMNHNEKYIFSYDDNECEFLSQFSHDDRASLLHCNVSQRLNRSPEMTPLHPSTILHPLDDQFFPEADSTVADRLEHYLNEHAVTSQDNGSISLINQLGLPSTSECSDSLCYDLKDLDVVDCSPVSFPMTVSDEFSDDLRYSTDEESELFTWKPLCFQSEDMPGLQTQSLDGAEQMNYVVTRDEILMNRKRPDPYDCPTIDKFPTSQTISYRDCCEDISIKKFLDSYLDRYLTNSTDESDSTLYQETTMNEIPEPPNEDALISEDDPKFKQFKQTQSCSIDSAVMRADETSSTSYSCLWYGCPWSGLSQAQLVEHLRLVHIDSVTASGVYTCLWAHCSRQRKPFNAKYKLVIHCRIHSGEKPNLCKRCGKAFSRRENLKIHVRSHTGERPYTCKQPGCNRQFSNSSDRAKHQRTHKHARPYVCTFEQCQRRYTDPSSLRKHIKLHYPDPTTTTDQTDSKLLRFDHL